MRSYSDDACFERVASYVVFAKNYSLQYRYRRAGLVVNCVSPSARTEMPFPFELTSGQASILAAFIGAGSALAVMVVRDLFIEQRKEQRRLRRELIDRKLTQIYSPLWIAFGGERGQIGNVLASAEMRVRLSAHFHLLTPELQDMISRVISMGRFEDGDFRGSLTEGERIIEISPSFGRLVLSEIEKLRKQYEEIK